MPLVDSIVLYNLSRKLLDWTAAEKCRYSVEGHRLCAEAAIVP
jgi:hypothetical protein